MESRGYRRSARGSAAWALAFAAVGCSGQKLATPDYGVSLARAELSVTTGHSVQLAATARGGVTWTIGAGGGSITLDGFYTAPMTPGPSIAIATSTRDSTRSASVAIAVVLPPPAVSMTVPAIVTAGVGAYGASVPLAAGVTYRWSIAGGSIAGGSSSNAIQFAVTASPGGALSLECQVLNAAGDSTTAAGAARVIAPPPAPAIAGLPASGLITGGYGGTASVVSGDYAISWTIAGGTLISGQGSGSVSFRASGAGSLSLAVQFDNQAGGVTSVARTLTIVPPAPPPSIRAPTFLLANTPGATAIAAAPGATSLRWSLSAGTATSPLDGATLTFTPPSASGALSLTATAFDAAGDGAPATVAAQVEVHGVQLLAGAPGGLGFLDGPGAEARLLSPVALAADSAGSLFIADYTTLRRFASGNLTTLAGSISAPLGCSGTGAGASLPWVSGVALDGKGSSFVSGHDGTICRVDASGTATAFASVAGGVDGLAAGAGKLAAIHNGTLTELDQGSGLVLRTTDVGPLVAWSTTGIAVADDGTVYVAGIRSAQSAVVESVVAGVVTQLVSNPTTWPTHRCDATWALCAPASLLVEAGGSLIVGDVGNSTLVRVANGVATTIAGVRSVSGYQDGPAFGALLGNVAGVAKDSIGNLFIGDGLNGLLRKLSPDGYVTTVAGVPSGAGRIDGPGIKARLTMPVSVAVGPRGDLLVAEYGGRVLRGTPGGLWTTLAAYVPAPTHVVFGPGGQMLVSSQDSAIRAVGLDGSISVFAGTPGVRGTKDANALSAQFGAFAVSSGQTTQNFAGGAMAFDGVDTLYVADADNSSVRAIKQGVVSTPWSYATQVPAGRPEGVAVWGGNIYVLVDGNRIEQRAPDGTLRSVVPLGGASVYIGGLAVDSGGALYVEEPLHNRVLRISSAGAVTTAIGDPKILAARPGVLPASLGSPVSLSFGPPGAPNVDALFIADFPENAILVARP